jgi:hypothetical protein
VKRGKWVLEQLLCQSPPPPPPGVEGLPEVATTGSVRQRMEAHRTNPTCAACHAIMDPIGFSMESYDGVGAWRTDDGGFPVDSSGALPDGRSFQGAKELGQLLKGEPSTPQCMATRLFTYALGRGPEAYDACSLEEITAGFQEGGHSLKSLMVSLATHPAFKSRRGEPE